MTVSLPTETVSAQRRGAGTSLLDWPLAVGLLIFLGLLPFHLVIKKLAPGPVGTYWKEILLALLVGLWGLRQLLGRQFRLSATPLDTAVLAYLGLLLLRFVLDHAGWQSAWGLYVSVLYLPVFWLVPAVLRRFPRAGPGLMGLLTAVGGLVALGGLVEFVVNVPLWPSDEMVLRQGFPDMYVYGTHLRRVYFVFDSPTTLANTLAVLLPLALVLTLQLRRWWLRLAAGLAAGLMAACIIVTFSRGIWVAVALSLGLMGLVGGLPRFGPARLPGRRSLAVGLGALALVGLIWAGFIAWQSGAGQPTAAGVVELSPQAYQAAPVTPAGETLLQRPADFGQAITQTWTVPDPLARRPDTRVVLYEHPPQSGKEEIIYRVTVPAGGALRFAIALAPEVWAPEKGDGAEFQIYVTDPAAEKESRFVFARYLNPKQSPSDRRWRNFVVDLSPWAGRAVNLSFITEDGPAGDWSYDWAGWAELQMVTAAPEFFSAVQPANAVAQHVGSIFDWSRDETNRDRLAAWSLGWSAWQAAPVWGQGLGATGVAALRVNPAQAFVTESQVLKALVELGLPGLLALFFLWFQIARVGYRAYRAAAPAEQRLWLLGVLTGLLVVFIEGWVYQNLETKQINAYFWALTGLLAFLARAQTELA